MTKKNETKPEELEPVVATGDLLKYLESAGKALSNYNKARADYDSTRAKLLKQMKKEGIKLGVPVYGKNYWAINAKETCDYIDPNDFIAEVSSKQLRRRCLRVLMGETRTAFKKDKDMLDTLITTTENEEPTLRVRKITTDEP